MQLQLTRAHAGVAALITASWIVHHVALGFPVMKARKLYGVQYPTLYATEADCPNEEDRKKYNCIQRAQQNGLETQTTFLSMVLVAGLKYPITTTFGGIAYLLGRLLYAKGYYTYEPTNRRWGFLPMYAGFWTLLGTNIKVVLDLAMGWF